MVGDKVDIVPWLIETVEKTKECVMLKIRFFRHAEKADKKDVTMKAGLSLKGEKDAEEFGKRFSGEKILLGYSSGVNRANRTVELIFKGAGQAGVRIIHDSRLSFLPYQYSKETTDRIMALVAKEGEIAMTRACVATGYKKPDAGTDCSAEFGRNALVCVRDICTGVGEEDGLIIVGSHSNIIEHCEAVLKDCFNLEQLGGPLDYLEEALEFQYSGDLKKLIVRVRGGEPRAIDLDALIAETSRKIIEANS